MSLCYPRSNVGEEVCLMPYYQPNESPQESMFYLTHYVDVNLLKTDILMVDEENNKLTIHIIQNIHWFDNRVSYVKMINIFIKTYDSNI